MLETKKKFAQNLKFFTAENFFCALIALMYFFSKMADEEEPAETDNSGIIPVFASLQDFLSSDQDIREVRVESQELC